MLPAGDLDLDLLIDLDQLNDLDLFMVVVGIFIILLGNIIIVSMVQHGNLPMNRFSIFNCSGRPI